MKKLFTGVMFLIICLSLHAGWWVTTNFATWNVASVSDYPTALAAVDGLNKSDIFWGDNPDSSGPWIDFYWDGQILWGWAVSADTLTTPWHGEFSSYSEAYASASSALSSDPDFSGAFTDPTASAKKQHGKGHGK